MVVSVLLLLVGFVALIVGADKMVDGASSLARRFGVSDIVIGLTVVAFGTSAPELVVNVFASISGSTEMVLGNVLGSNLFNVLAILGVCAIITPLTVKTNTTWIEIPLSLLAAVCVLVVAADFFLDGSENVISRSDGITLLLFFIIFLAYNISTSKSDLGKDNVVIEKLSAGKATLFFILGLAGLIIGGRLIVTNAVNIAETIGLSERVIGLTIVSIGTSLPELATSIVAVRKKNVDIAIGNVVGSNIFNIFLVLGTSTAIVPLAVIESSFIDIILNVVIGILLFIFLFTGKGRRIDRWEGVIFVLGYIIYISYLVLEP